MVFLGVEVLCVNGCAGRLVTSHLSLLTRVQAKAVPQHTYGGAGGGGEDA
jgi:hypothetical protein